MSDEKEETTSDEEYWIIRDADSQWDVFDKLRKAVERCKIATLACEEAVKK